LNQSLNKVFDQSSDYTDVSLHHIIAALCKLSGEGNPFYSYTHYD
jgi:hypothetical protein